MKCIICTSKNISPCKKGVEKNVYLKVAKFAEKTGKLY